MKIRALVLAVAAVLLAVSGCAPLPAAADSVAPAATAAVATAAPEVQNTLTVSATGTVSVTPDVAYVTVGVVTQNRKMQAAQSANKDVMNALFAALKGAGMAGSDMRTTRYSVYPTHNYRDSGDKIVGYEVTNMAELTITDIDRIGEYIDIAAECGANTTGSISFGVRDEQAAYHKALALAMQAAGGKAAAIAEAGGLTIVGARDVTETQIYGGGVYRNYDEAAMASSATPIEAGEMEVTATINVVYVIE